MGLSNQEISHEYFSRVCNNAFLKQQPSGYNESKHIKGEEHTTVQVSAENFSTHFLRWT
jgi:hypothetical protein